MRRAFILVSRGVKELSEDLPRLCRCLSSALMVSHGLRRDAVFVLVISGEAKYVTFDARRLRSVSPDENSLKGVFRRVFRYVREGRSKPHWGVRIYRGTLEDVCSRFVGWHKTYQARMGMDIRNLDLRFNRFAFAAPFEEWPQGVQRLLESKGFKPVSPSVRLLKAEYSFVLVNNELDRAWLSRGVK